MDSRDDQGPLVFIHCTLSLEPALEQQYLVLLPVQVNGSYRVLGVG